MSEQKQTFFVTGATGAQGGAVAYQLLSFGHKVHALVRNPTCPASISLASAGATLIPGSFTSLFALASASNSCSGVYLNVSPTQPTSLELTHAQNIISAAKTAGIPRIVCSTVCRAEEHETFPLWREWERNNTFLTSYWRNKAEIQRMVRDAGFESWTVLQPAWSMSNWRERKRGYYWKEDEETGKKMIASAFGRDTVIDLTCPEDVGRLAAKALMEGRGGVLDGKIVRVASEGLTVKQLAETMSDVAGTRVRVCEWSKEEVEDLRNKSPMVGMQLWAKSGGSRVDFEEVRGYGVKLTSFKEFLEDGREALLETLKA